MVLSEAEAEARLAALRREREALDRSITDLTLYLELGRRLSGAAAVPEPSRPTAGPAPAGAGPAGFAPSPHPRPHPEVPERSGGLEGGLQQPRPVPEGAFEAAHAAPRIKSGAGSQDEGGSGREPDRVRAARGPLEAPLEAEPAGAGPALPEAVLARRHGRALIEAALAALEEAGRPLHAGEIWAVLDRRGFSLPGHDPVAALNTRLWKRAVPGAPLRRLGDAVYALADEEPDR